MLNNFFKLPDKATTISTELVAGATTFITMVYVLAVVPIMLAATGMAKEATFLATCMIAGFASIAMGLAVNVPIALAPGMGLTAYFATVATQHGGISWQVALGAVFISGIIFLLLTLAKIRQVLVEAIPQSLKNAMVVGIGLFIALIGFKMSSLVTVALSPSSDIKAHSIINYLHFSAWHLTLGQLLQPEALLTLIGLGTTAGLIALRVKGAILIGILLSTIVGIPLGLTNIHNITLAWPSFHSMNIGALNLAASFNPAFLSIIFTFTFVGLLDTFGTTVSTASKAGILDAKGNSPLIGKAMFVDAASTTLGAILGVPAVTAYVESMAGVTAGGRTGLTAVTTGILFLLAIVLSPLFIIIPNAATAPALIIIGSFMLSGAGDIDFTDFSEAFPAFLTIILMPLTYNIANGIAAGIIFYILLKLVMGKWRAIHWMMYCLAALIAARYVFFI